MYEETITQKIYGAFFRQGIASDLKLVVVWLAAAILAIYLPPLNETPVRVVLALPVMLIIPGYCVILALFPKEGDIDLMERIVLSRKNSSSMQARRLIPMWWNPLSR